MIELKSIEGESVYTMMAEEMDMIKNEVFNLDDEAIIDECDAILTRMHVPNIFQIVETYYRKRKLSPEERKTLDWFYILVHTQLCWREDGKILHFR